MPAAYNGIRTIQIKTFTAAYVPVTSPWVFQSNSLQPMEFAGKLGPFPAFGSIAFGGAVFDNVTGATSFSVGNLAAPGFFSLDFGQVIWKDNILSGFSFGQALVSSFNTISYPLTLGVPLTATTFSTGLTFNVPFAHVAPNAYAAATWITKDNELYFSYNTGPFPATDQAYGFWNLNASINNGTGYKYPYDSLNVLNGVIPYNGANYVITGYLGGIGTQKIVATDFRTYSTAFATHLTNPPASSVDLDVLINAVATQVADACYGGWLWMFDTVLTIGARTLNGYGIYVAPDFSSYQVLEIIPTDTTSAGWQGLLGTKVGKFDQSGILWMKAGGNASIVFKALPPTQQIVQTFPPIDLPSPPSDTELMLNAYRGPQI